jgi:hypothetical protein
MYSVLRISISTRYSYSTDDVALEMHSPVANRHHAAVANARPKVKW